MESATTAILRDASGKMHHGILFERRLRVSVYKISGNTVALTEIPTICNISELSKSHKILTSFFFLFSFDEIPMKFKN